VAVKENVININEFGFEIVIVASEV